MSHSHGLDISLSRSVCINIETQVYTKTLRAALPCRNAVEHDRPEMLRYLRVEARPPCPWDAEIRRVAAHGVNQVLLYSLPRHAPGSVRAFMDEMARLGIKVWVDLQPLGFSGGGGMNYTTRLHSAQWRKGALILDHLRCILPTMGAHRERGGGQRVSLP